MRKLEGRGFHIRAGLDAPWAGSLSALALEGLSPGRSAESWMALRQLAELSALLPGGLHLIWNEAPAWYGELEVDAAQGFWEAVGALPNLVVHLAETPEALRHASFRTWRHGAEPPSGSEGERWRSGALGFVKRRRDQWRLPGFGRIPEGGGGLLGGDDLAPAFLWGEVAIPLPALVAVDSGRVANAMNELQSSLERGLAQRLGLHAWPAAFPFHRRRAQWRLALLGGAEYMLAGGSWEDAAIQIRTFAEDLGERLKTTLQIGACDDPDLGLQLGRQAMGEGLPWRGALPLPPEAPAFTPGFAADPRRPSPLEARAFFPPALEALLDAPPLARLRVPAPPSAAAVAGLLATLGEPPAILWMPPASADPAPFVPENAWAPAVDFPSPPDPAAGVQLALFEDLEA